MDGFPMPYRFDRNKHGGGVMVYIQDTISSKILEKYNCQVEKHKCNFAERIILYLRMMNNILIILIKPLTLTETTKLLLAGDFNPEVTEHYIESFLYEFELSNLLKEKTCFKNMQNPSCIDILITNNSCAFQQTTTDCVGLSDGHKLVLTALKTSIPKSNPRQITYRDHKKFNSLEINNKSNNVLTKENIDNCTKFNEKFLEVLDKHASLKRKLLRVNNASYVFLFSITKNNNEEILPRKSVL